MKIIDLKETTGIDFFSYADYPLTNDINDIWMVCGFITDQHLSLGYNKEYKDYIDITKDLTSYTFSRYPEGGGVMWFGNTFLCKIIFPNFEEDGVKETSVIARIMDLIKTKQPDTELTLNDNYVYLNDNKIAGVGKFINKKNNRLSILFMINIKPIPYKVKQLYHTKKFDNITHIDLDYNDIKIHIVNGLAHRWNTNIETINEEDIDISKLKQINTDENWIDHGKRGDIGL